MLKISNLTVKYGGISALKGISFEIPERSIFTLLGANGAGKSTTVRAISGMIPIFAGEITFQNTPITSLPPHLIQKMGLVHIPEGRKIFANLTVSENLIMGAYHNRDKHNIKLLMDRIYSKFPILLKRKDQLGGTLSGGEQQMLAIGRAMMSRPKLLMMDEPSLGLAPMVVASVFKIIQEIRDEGVTVFLIEQNANAALKIADQAVLLETGEVVLQGTGEELLDNPAVKRAYLGQIPEDLHQNP